MHQETQNLINHLDEMERAANMAGYAPGEDLNEAEPLTKDEIDRIHADHQAWRDRKAAWCLAAGM